MGLGSGIRDPRSGIRDPRSGIRKKPIPDPGSRGQKGTGSRIRIRNTGFLNKIPNFLIKNQDPDSTKAWINPNSINTFESESLLPILF
jgi:hypothetical protein